MCQAVTIPAKTTILVPTFKRPFHLERLLSYYAACRFRGCVRILDSSPGTHLIRHHHEGLQVEWHDFDADIEILDKVLEGLRLIDTPYVQMCADDDFIDPVGINECERFLDSAPDFSAAQGECVHFQVSVKSAQDLSTKVIRHEPMSNIDDNDPVRRLFTHITNYRPTHYALQRTERQVSEFSRIAQISGAALTLLEPMFSFNCVISGKVKRLPICFEYREQHDQRLSGRIPGWADLITSSDWQPQFQIFGSFISDLLKRQGLSTDESDHLALLACQEWSKLCFNKYFVRKPEVEKILRQVSTHQIPNEKAPAPFSRKTPASLIRKFIGRRLRHLRGGSHATPPSLPVSDQILQAVRMNAESIYNL